MISLLVISRNKIDRENYVSDFCKKQQIDPFDITTLQPQTSLGIEDVRELQKKSFLKPFKSPEKALIIFDAHLATTEAQNALLKLLEEPPVHTYIILTASSVRPFLPTVLSRCKLVELDGLTTSVSKKEDESLVDRILSANTKEKLYLAQELAKEKTELPAKLEALLHISRRRMLENPENPLYARLAIALSNAYNQSASTNVNGRFLLEHAFLQVKQTL